MIYVMSDLHGCYQKYKKMLSLLNLKENDTLYILGDIVDRGPDGIKILSDLIDRENVITLRGNHDHKAGVILSRWSKYMEAAERQKFEQQLEFWLSDGGKPTCDAFLTLDEEKKAGILKYLKNMPFCKKIEVNGAAYFLAHTVPEKDYMPKQPEQCPEKELVLGEPDYEETYYEHITIVTGHTPTFLIDKNSKGRIWRGNNHIAVDCGAVFGNPLGCICLDTGEEFYAE